MRHLFALALCALPLAASPAAAEDCRLQLVTSVDMGIDQVGGIFLPMSINATKVNLLIDTGGVDSMLTESTVAKLGLIPRPLRAAVSLSGFGGVKFDHFVEAQDIEFGGLKTPRMRFLVMPDDMVPVGVDGTIAPDILRAYDDDFDFANAKFNLVSPDHCPGKVVYWTNDPHTEIAFRLDFTHVSFPMVLDGKPVLADMDTGSSRSTFSLEEAQSLFGIAPDSPLLVKDPRHDVGYRYPFKSLTFGGVTVANPDILLIPDATSRQNQGRRITIGIGVLKQLHLYIAYHEQKLYITPASAH